MRVLLDIPDNKATSLMEVLKSISYLKTTIISEEKAHLIDEIKQSIEEIKLVRAGKLKARPIEELLNEL